MLKIPLWVVGAEMEREEKKMCSHLFYIPSTRIESSQQFHELAAMINPIFQVTNLRLREVLYVPCNQAHTARNLGSWGLNVPKLMSSLSQQVESLE